MKCIRGGRFCRRLSLVALLLIGVLSAAVALGAGDLSMTETNEIVAPMSVSGNSSSFVGERIRITYVGNTAVISAKGDNLSVSFLLETDSFQGDISLTARAYPKNGGEDPAFLSDPVTVGEGNYNPGEVAVELKPAEGIQLADYEEYTQFTVTVVVSGKSAVTSEAASAGDSLDFFLIRPSYIDIGDVALFSVDNRYLGLDITWSGKWDAAEGTPVYFPLSSNGANYSIDLQGKVEGPDAGSFSGLGWFPPVSELKDPFSVGVRIKEADGSFLSASEEVPVSAIDALDMVEIPKGVLLLGEQSLEGIAAECVVIPADTKSVESAALSECRNMKVLIVKGEKTVIPEEALSGCDQLKYAIVNERNTNFIALAQSLGLEICRLGW